MNKAEKTILIVDDDVDYLFQMEMTLKQFGYQTITAGGQAEAEHIISSTKPDLAIFDLMMEHEDSGFILSYKMKKNYPMIPIIIMTAVTAETGMTFDIRKQSEHLWVKADAFLDKGIRKDILEKEIESFLQINNHGNT